MDYLDKAALVAPSCLDKSVSLFQSSSRIINIFEQPKQLHDFGKSINFQNQIMIS